MVTFAHVFIWKLCLVYSVVLMLVLLNHLKVTLVQPLLLTVLSTLYDCNKPINIPFLITESDLINDLRSHGNALN